MARKRSGGSFPTASGASTVIARHVAKCGTKGNSTPGTVRQSSDSAAANRVGGHAGGKFDNVSLGK